MVNYKNNGVPQNKNVPESQVAKEFQPLNLNKDEVDKIVKSIKYSLRDPNLSRYAPKSLPSGQCFPNNDSQSRTDIAVALSYACSKICVAWDDCQFCCLQQPLP